MERNAIFLLNSAQSMVFHSKSEKTQWRWEMYFHLAGRIQNRSTKLFKNSARIFLARKLSRIGELRSLQNLFRLLQRCYL